MIEMFQSVFENGSLFERGCHGIFEGGKMDTVVLTTAEKRGNFKKFCLNMKVGMDRKLQYKGRRHDFRPVPTPEQMDNILYKVHVKAYKEGESDFNKEHYRGAQRHIDALSNAGFGYPSALGGLAALVNE